MRQDHLSERGSANWPFIITLILLIVFGYLWFDERDKREVAQAESKDAIEAESAARDAATRFLDYGVRLSGLVGWQDASAKELIPAVADDATEAEKKAEQVGRSLAGPAVVTDITKMAVHLTPDGVLDGQPGLLSVLKTDAQVAMVKNIRTAASDEVGETPANFDWMTPDFKAKLAEIQAMEIPIQPSPPADPDDVDAQSKYNDDLARYEQAVAAYQQAIDELGQMDGFKRWEGIIKGPQRFAPDTREVVTLDFFTQALAPKVTVETLLGYPPRVIAAIIDEFKKNKEADAGIIDQVRGDAAAKDETINSLQSDLSTEQQTHVDDVQRLQGELSVANETAESNRLDATNAMQRVQVVEEEMRRAVTDRESRINALENARRIDKERRDLKIRRDEKDGSVLSVSPTMGTAIIDLGSQHKIYPGLKFNVSYNGRGGIRLPRGQVMVTRVLGPNSAKVSIVGQVSPMSRGDSLHNPLWDTRDEINVFLAGELQKYPLDIARARLEKMGVTIDSQINGATDYIVVPDSMAAPAPAGDEDDMEDEETVGGQSEYERIQALARSFGATVITEKMLNEFLDY